MMTQTIARKSRKSLDYVVISQVNFCRALYLHVCFTPSNFHDGGDDARGILSREHIMPVTITNTLEGFHGIISSCLPSVLLDFAEDRMRASFPRVATPLRDAANSDPEFQGRRSSRECLAA